MSTTNDGVKTVHSLLASARAELASLDLRIAPLLQERQGLDDKIQALEHLASLYGNEMPAGTPSASATSPVKTPPAPAPSTNSAGSSIREVVRHRVKVIISDSKDEALHINSIAKQYETRGWQIPGQGLPANLTAHLSGATDIYSPKRGWWAVGTDPAPRPKKKPTKRRARAAKPRQ